MQLGRVGERESRAALAVLEEWADHQAVANVLFYPDLLPPQTRIHFLMKGLHETEFPYFTLAAVLGLQHITGQLDEELPDEDLERRMEAAFDEERWGDFAEFGEQVASMYQRALGPGEWDALRERLLALIERGGEVMREWQPTTGGSRTLDEAIADRVSAMLLGFVTRKDTTQLVRLLDHPSEGVRHNVLTTLLFLWRKEEVERLVANDVAAGTLLPATAEFVASAREPMSPLWSYIPNLGELYPVSSSQAP